jgi:hypothetical protein
MCLISVRQQLFCLESCTSIDSPQRVSVILLSPAGQEHAVSTSKATALIYTPL